MTKTFISEKIIDLKATQISTDDSSIISEFETQQPAVLAYLFSNSFDILTQQEKEYLLYLTLVIWAACMESSPIQEQILAEEIEAVEETNWTMLNEAVAKSFREKLDVFFDGYPQEDLLAFVEDALIISAPEEEVEEFEVTKEGREPIFIALKTIIDCLCNKFN